jgi:hypothetical protein
MALGRDALDNVSVAVIQMAAERSRALRPFAAAVAVGLLAIVAIGVALLRRGGSPPATRDPVADLGYAVVVEGSAATHGADGQAQTVSNLGTIAAGRALSALDNLRLVFQTRAGSSADIATLTYYLAEGGSMELTLIDPQPTAGQTVVTLSSGRILVERSGGSREASILYGDVRVGLAAAGSAAVGVAADSRGIAVDCLIGGCTVELAGVLTPIDAPREVIVAGTSLGPGVVVPEDAFRAWSELCGGCLPIP